MIKICVKQSQVVSVFGEMAFIGNTSGQLLAVAVGNTVIAAMTGIPLTGNSINYHPISDLYKDHCK
jgi:hypothetical protein